MGGKSVSHQETNAPPKWAVNVMPQSAPSEPRYRTHRLAGDAVPKTSPIERPGTSIAAIVFFMFLGGLIGAGTMLFAVWQSLLTLPN